jgi:preprotein translocase subunit SecE
VVLDSLPKANFFNWENILVAKATNKAPKKTSSSSDATVVRISAKDDKVTQRPVEKKTPKNETKKSATNSETVKRGPLAAFLGYFTGAWQELKLVRWPTRKSTWGLTLAVLLFSAFFVVFILLIDAGFKYLFEVIYKQ